MLKSGHLVRCVVAVLLMAPPACGEDRVGEPATASNFDAVGTRSALEAMDRVFRIAPWVSFRGLGERLGVSAPRNAVRGGIAAVPRLPFELRGQTFVFDPTLQRYLPDSSRAGAPPNGVRFVLYAVDSLTGLPAVEREIGYAEITDEGDALPSGVALRLRVVAGGMTHLDYRVGADGTPTSGSLAATGFAADSTTHLGFDIGIASVGAPGVAPESLAVRFAFAIPERSLRGVPQLGSHGYVPAATSWGALPDTN